jgi:hypothetical protein
MWTLEDAIEVCTLIEGIAPEYGFHVALTGGLLYKQGERKDCDILLYRIRERHDPDWDGLWSALSNAGFVKIGDFGWCKKAIWKHKYLDIFDPEAGGEYPGWEVGCPHVLRPLP